MKTWQLAVYLTAFVVAVGIVFGLVPPMLNATSTAINAAGLATVGVTIFGLVLVVYETWRRQSFDRSTCREKRGKTQH